MPQVFIKNLRVIHLGLCIGPALFGIAVYFVNSTVSKMDTSFSNPLSIVGIALGFLIIISTFIYTKKVKEINVDDTIAVKKNKYTSAYIMMLALIEAAAIFNIIVYLLTFNTFHLVLASVFIVNMVSKMPNKSHIMQLLNCTEEEL